MVELDPKLFPVALLPHSHAAPGPFAHSGALVGILLRHSGLKHICIQQVFGVLNWFAETGILGRR